VPSIDAGQVFACLFTSGSTGEPQPYFKRWGPMVLDSEGEARRFGIGAGHAILGTVPPQHMYGLESTVLLPLHSGAALTSERPYYPADIDAAASRVPGPRVLFTTPFHLRAWMESGDPAALEGHRLRHRAALGGPRAPGRGAHRGRGSSRSTAAPRPARWPRAVPTQSVEWDALEGVRVWNEGTQAMASGAHIEQPTPLQDVIEVEGDGTRFLLHGRTTDMVNIAGKRNSLGYLNHQLTAIPGVVDGAFFLPDEVDADAVTRLTAFVVAPTLTAAKVLAALRERIDPAFLPRPLVLVDRLPRSLTGKLPREALRTLAETARTRRPGGG
jgi:acyl-coenzyme A synthetase/AMP-(fatty) acid ligase